MKQLAPLAISCLLMSSGADVALAATAKALVLERSHTRSMAQTPSRAEDLSVSAAKIDTTSALKRVELADREALSDARSVFVGAVATYVFTEGALYSVDTAPERVSDIALQPGETLVSVAAGDTARWIIGDTTSGSGPQRRAHVLVKPLASGLATNLIIATDRRVYHVELKSSAGAAMTSIAWTYADDPLLALKAQALPETRPAVAADVTVDGLNFDYRIEGDSPSWRPVRAFDDGRQVFIEFPPGLAESEAPPLFILGEDGNANLVNYRLRGRYYVVDRLFGTAELRLGQKHQLVVRILREGSRQRRKAS